jgi:hypothetical protein
MFPDEVFKERRELCEKISAVPPDYMKDNVAALLAITSEFQRSLALELQIIHRVRRLGVEDREGVDDFAMKFADYVAQRGFDLERTRCGQISRIYRTQIASLRGGTLTDQSRVKELEDFLERFENADREFTEEIEPVMARALATVQKINGYVQANETAEARQCQTDFVRQYEDESKRLKEAIKGMNQLGNRLIDEL